MLISRGTFTADLSDFIIRKVEVSTKVNGTFTLNLKYDAKSKFKQLPSSLIFSFKISKLNIPKRFTSQGDGDKSETSTKGSAMGKVYIDYSNYKVNQGLPDSLFEEKKK